MKEIVTFIEPVRNRELKLAYFNVAELDVPPFQRDVSPSLVKSLGKAIEKLGFLVPIVVVPVEGKFYVIDGRHRLEAVKSLGISEILAVVVDPSYYHYILELNTEKPPNVKDKSKQAYRLYVDLLKENPTMVEEDITTYVEEPYYITLGFAIEEIDPKFPAGFYDEFLSKIDNFLYRPLEEAVEERRRRAKAVYELNQVVNEKFEELALDNALLKGEIVRKGVQKAFGVRVRVIDEEFYRAIERLKEAVRSLEAQDL